MASATLLASDFLQTLVFYIRNIHQASTPAAHLKALREVQSYLDSLTQENHQAVAQLVLERTRLSQQCKIPQLEGRYCDIICDRSKHLGHQETFAHIQEALAELSTAERHIDLWRKALVLPLHCLQPPQSFQAPVQPAACSAAATAARRREHGRRHPDLEQSTRPQVVPIPASVPLGSKHKPPAFTKTLVQTQDYVELDPPSNAE